MSATITDLVLMSSLPQLELGGALRPEHRRALRAHLPQLGEPALVALAPRGDAALQPVRLDLQLGVELVGGARFLGIDLLLPRLVAAEADVLAAQLHPRSSHSVALVSRLRNVRSWLITTKAPL